MFNDKDIKAGKFIIVTAILIHLLLGITLLITQVPTKTSFINPLLNLFPGNSYAWLYTGLMFMFAGGLAVIGLFREHRRTAVLFVSFQQLLMLFSMFSSCVNIVVGKYSDGYIPMANASGEITFNSHLFIFNDQIIQVILGIAHTISVFIIYKSISK